LVKNPLVPIPDLLVIMDQAVQERFSRIPQVQAIYRTFDGGAITFWLFTSNEAYDDGLMDTLLSLEEDLLDSYPEPAISFRYVPSVLCPSPLELVGARAVSIFQR
jgi:hypothetical protein